MSTPEHTKAIERLRRNIIDEPHPDAPRFLLEHLAVYGPDGIDVRDLANRALEIEEDE